MNKNIFLNMFTLIYIKNIFKKCKSIIFKIVLTLIYKNMHIKFMQIQTIN